MTPDNLAARWREQTERLALALAGEDDDAVSDALARFAKRISEAWAAAMPGATTAQFSEIAEELVSEVQTRRREIEAARGAFTDPRSGAADAH